MPSTHRLRLGAYVYPVGVAFVNSTFSDYERELEMGALPAGSHWWDRASVLTHDHEIDHFQNFVMSPYLQHVSHLSEAYASACNNALAEVEQMGGWTHTHPQMPLALQRVAHRDAKRAGATFQFDFQIDHAASTYTLLGQLLESRGPSDSFAARLSYVTGMSGDLKGVDMSGYHIAPGIPVQSSLFPEGLSVNDLLEASARLQELRLLKMWGASNSQVKFWYESMIFGRYASILPRLWDLVSQEIILATLALCFRVSFFPFLRGDAVQNATLAEIHPGHTFISMVEFLLNNHKAQPVGKDTRNAETRLAFLEDAVEALVARYDIVTDGDRFRRSDAALWRAFLDPSNAELLGQRRLQPYINTLGETARVRDIRFNQEARYGALTLAMGPTLIPYSIAYRDGEKTAEGFRARRSGVSFNSLSAIERVAVQHAFGDLTIMGDKHLAGYVGGLLGLDANDFLSLYGAQLYRIPKEFRRYHVIRMSDEDRTYSYEGWSGPDRYRIKREES